MGHTALGHCCLGLIHWHCTAVVVVVVVVMVVVVVVVEEVGIGRGHSITRCQVRCPFKDGGTVYGRGQPGVSDGRAGVQGRAEVGPTSRWATQEGHVDPVHGQRRTVAKKNKIK